MKDSRNYPSSASADPLTIRPSTGRYSKIPASAVYDHELGHASLRVLAALGTHADSQGKCWPSQGTLAKNLGMSRQSVSRAIAELVERGHLESVRRKDEDTGGNRPNLYRILYPTPMQHDCAKEHGIDAGVATPAQWGSNNRDAPPVPIRRIGDASSDLHKRSQENDPTGTSQENVPPLHPPSGGSAPSGARASSITHPSSADLGEFAALWRSKFPWPAGKFNQQNAPYQTWHKLRVTAEEARFVIEAIRCFPGMTTSRTTRQNLPGEWLRQTLEAYRGRSEGDKEVIVPNPAAFFNNS